MLHDGYMKDGNLITGQPKRSYPSSQYRRLNSTYFVLCPCAIKQCIRKCCEPGLVGIENEGSWDCSLPPNETMDILDNFTIPKYNNEEEVLEMYETDKFHVIYGISCPKFKYTATRLEPSVKYYGVTDNGSLWNRDSKSFQPGLFCLERFVDTNFQIEPIACLENNWKENEFLYMLILMCSLICLLATFFVYAIIQELRNMHGKSLMCQVVSLFICYTTRLIKCGYELSEVTDNVDENIDIHHILDRVNDFFYIANLQWLSVMCFDLCSNLSRLKPSRKCSRSKETKTFIIYSTYAWGLSFIFLKYTWYIDENDDDTSWLNVKWVYYAARPTVIIVFIALLMYIYAAIKIVKYKRETEKILSGTESNTNKDREKQRYSIYLNLFMVMGAALMSNVKLEWAFVYFYFLNQHFIFTIIFSYSQGMFIFLIFVCKKRVLNLLYKKLYPRY